MLYLSFHYRMDEERLIMAVRYSEETNMLGEVCGTLSHYLSMKKSVPIC